MDNPSRYPVLPLETGDLSRLALPLRGTNRMPFRARSDSATGSTVVEPVTPLHVDTNMPAWRAKEPILGTRALFKSCLEPGTPHLSQVNPEELDRLLLGYPEPDRSFLVRGFTQGFKLQHEGPRVLHGKKSWQRFKKSRCCRKTTC